MKTYIDLKNIFRKKYKELLCIEFGETMIKAVGLVREDRWYVVQIACGELPDSLKNNQYTENISEMKEYLREFLDKNKLTDFKNAVFLLEETLFASETFMLPAMEKNEILEAVKWEKQQLITDSDKFSEQIIIAPKRQDDMAEVLYYALAKELSKELEALSSSLELNLLALTVNNYGKSELTEMPCKNYLEADIEHALIKVYLDDILIDKENLIMSGDIKQQFLALINKFKNIYAADMEYIIGDSNYIQQMTLPDNLKVLKYTFNENIIWDGEFKNNDELSKIAVDYNAVITGAVKYYENELLNFSSKDFTFNKQSLVSVLIISIFSLFIIISGIIYGISVHNEKKLENLEKRLSDLGSWQQKYEYAQIQQRKISAMESNLRKLENNSICWHNVLEEVGKNIPRNCWIEEMFESSRKNKSVIEIRGKALSVSAAESFLYNLQKNQYFLKAELTEIKQRESSNDAIGFTLTLYMRDIDDGKNTENNEF